MIEAVKLEADIYPAGPRGLSAYEIYKKEGGQLSEEEWLKSLNGLTPTIGENGNWFLGTVDTGLPSRGPKGDTGSIKFIVVTELPTENIDETAIYMKPVKKPNGKNNFEELIYVNGKWEDLGTPEVEVDLSNYYTKDEANEELAKKQDNLTAGKNIVIENNTINAIIENEDYVILTDFPNTSAEQITFMQNAFDLALSGKTVLIVRSDNQYNYRASSDRNVYISPKIKDIDFSDKISASVSFNSPWFYRTETDVYGNNELEEYKTWLYIDCTVTKGVVTKVSFGMTSHNNTSYNRTLPVLSKTNKLSYTPTADYHPATKKYVDDNILLSRDKCFYFLEGPIRYDMIGSVNDTDVLNKLSQIMTDYYPKYLANSNLCCVIFGKDDTSASNGCLIALQGKGTKFYYTYPYRPTYSRWYGYIGYLDIAGTWNASAKTYTVDKNTWIRILSYTPSENYNPSTKLYTDKTHYEKMTGYDATKTQVLKNINGTLTWVDEV